MFWGSLKRANNHISAIARTSQVLQNYWFGPSPGERSHRSRPEVSATVFLAPQYPRLCSLIISHKLLRNTFGDCQERPPALIIRTWPPTDFLLGREPTTLIRFPKRFIISSKVNLPNKPLVSILNSPKKTDK